MRIEGTVDELLLEVECIDASENVGTATAMPEFAEKSRRSRKSEKG